MAKFPPASQSQFDFGDDGLPESLAPWDEDDWRQQLVAEVVFRDPPYGPYSYVVPSRLRGKLAVGQRVRVPLGRGHRTVTGWVIAIGTDRDRERADTKETPTKRRTLKPVSGLVDESPLVSAELLTLAHWLAGQTLTFVSQVLDTMVPGPVKGHAGTREVLFVVAAADAIERRTKEKLPPKQAMILDLVLSHGRPMTLPDLCQRADSTPAPITALRKKGFLSTESRRTRTQDIEVPLEPADRSWTLSSDQAGVVAELIAALRPVDLDKDGAASGTAPVFGGASKVLDRIADKIYLLHGVTGSGKTEVYLQVAQEVLARGQQVLVLVPEISLTPQTVQRFQARLGETAILHSRQTDAERAFHWDQIATGRVSVVVGTRSAVFAPLTRLGLVVIDEEHDASFKQDQAPRYHARAVAEYRSALTGAPVILGSATPSLESFQRAETGRYHRLVLPARVADRPLPTVRLVDQRDTGGRRRARGVISEPLDREIRRVLADQGQVILLLNRRGFSTSVQCPACGFVCKCPHCDLPLTHHREQDGLVCHLCDHRETPPPTCPDCGSTALRFSGVGTEKLEDEVRRRFSSARIARLDGDTLKKRGSHVDTLAEFRQGDLDLLLGTQMIAKGLDFPNVMLVGVINSDTGLHFPDFRAAERTFQLVTQVAGRTGRGSRGGEVVVQTFSPDHPAIDAARHHDYARFAAGELAVRREHGYPPFAEAVRIIVRGQVEERVIATIEAYAASLTAFKQAAACVPASDERRALSGQGRAGQGASNSDLAAANGAGQGGQKPHRAEPIDTAEGALRLLGPAPAPLAKIKGRYRWHLLIFSRERQRMLDAVRQALAVVTVPDDVERAVDVDPVDMQ